MKTPFFIAALIFGLGLFFILVWSISLYFVISYTSHASAFLAGWWRMISPVTLSVMVACYFVYFALRRYFIALQNKVNQGLSIKLNNKAAFKDRLDHVISDSKRTGRKYALVLVNVTRTAPLVGQHGQYSVDVLLQQVEKRLSEGLRASDTVAYFGQNDFAMLLEVEDQDHLVRFIEKVYLRTAQWYQIFGQRLDVGIMFGISLYPFQALTDKQLFDYAEAALRQARETDSPIVFHESTDQSEMTSFSLVQSLRQALDNDEFKLVFQPVVELQGKGTVYLEALLRWKDPAMHDVSIERTIQLAEKSNLIQPLTDWIMDTVCKQISESNIDDLVIGVNLSMIDLHDQYLPRRIEKCLNKYQVNPSKVMIEITEGQIMQEPDEVAHILAQLGVMGLSLSIDDFGTGQASLTYLKKLPVEKLKIDQSFVVDMVNDDDDRLIVKATIELAHTLDIKVIAEGVETADVRDLLAELDCDYVQGYFISRPLEANRIAHWYQSDQH